MTKVLARYHEIALKGGNRGFFLDRLKINLRRACSDLGTAKVRSLPGRLQLELPDDVPWETLRPRLSAVFGIANFSRVVDAPRDLDALAAAVLEAVRGQTFGSFRVRTKRSDKSFPHVSGTVDRTLGAAIHTATGVRVDLGQADLTVFVEVLHDRICFSFEKVPGPGGFPVGSAGRVMALLSGGIDSPVAAWRLMKRGCTVVLAHFHAFPLQDHSTIDKARLLAQALARWQYRSRLLLVPFGPVQQTIVAQAPAPLRVVLYRRFMVRIAEALAARKKAKALVTGESLGQVASQTLDNMSVIDAAAGGPVLRPLVGMDKEEITAAAQRLGSYPISIIPDQDCCTLFTPKHPATKARSADVARAESVLPIDEIVQGAVASGAIEQFQFPVK
jgi:thiamine biosynthesis protein ThiI